MTVVREASDKHTRTHTHLQGNCVSRALRGSVPPLLESDIRGELSTQWLQAQATEHFVFPDHVEAVYFNTYYPLHS